MGLFDKLKSLVSDDKKDVGTIEIVAQSLVKLSTLKMCQTLFSLRKSSATVLQSNQLATKWLLRLTALSVKSLKLTMLSQSNPTVALNCLFTSVSIRWN